ncbi:MAG TPA: hypothetical protein VMD59_21820 [Acidimicrobiales bacterium]|nr:hypothetical protein [Acidimicrobiales bacterium]
MAPSLQALRRIGLPAVAAALALVPSAVLLGGTAASSGAQAPTGRVAAASGRHGAGGGSAGHHGGGGGGASIPSGWAGFGGNLATWSKARHRDVTGCVAGWCFGAKVAGPIAAYAFNDVTTTNGRVTGWWQAMPQGTTPAQAEATALGLFPDDTQFSPLVVLKHDLFGASCAFLNVESKTLASWFGPKSVVATNGQVSIELFWLNPQGYPQWRPSDIDRVIVVPVAYTQGDNC